MNAKVTGMEEIWFTTTRKGGKRAWFYSRAAMRTMPMKLAEAELRIATGQSIEGRKPSWVR